MGVIYFNGISSKTVGLEVEHPPKYSYPERNYEIVHVPGRNGDIFINQNSFSNGERKYDISFGKENGDYTKMIQKISAWLHSAPNYARLEDSYEPDYFQLAVYHEGLEYENIFHQAGRATIVFDCKPQRFLKSGEYPITYTTNGLIKNPTLYPAKPYIKVYGSGSGTVRIGNIIVSLTSISSYVEIDCDIQDVFKGSDNKNNTATMTRFPEIPPGETNVSFTGGVTKIEIIPRWWTI